MASNDLKRTGLVFDTEGTKEFTKSLKEIKSELSDNEFQFKKTKLQYDDNTKALVKLTDKQEYYAKKVELQQEKTAQLRAELARYEASEGASEAAVERKRKALQKAELDLVSYEKSLKSVNEVLKKGNVNLDELAKKVKETGDQLTKTGESLTKNVTAPIVALGTASVVAFTTIDEAYDTIITKTGATGSALEDLQGTFDSIYGNFPFDTMDVANAIGEVNTRFGLTGDALEKASVSFLEFANINGTDVTSSIASVSRSLEASGEPFTKYKDLLDITTLASQKTGLSVDDLFASYEQYGSQLRQVGMDMGDSVALLAQIEKSGMNVETVFAALKTANKNWAAEGKSATTEFQKSVDAIKNAKTDVEALTLATDIFGSKSAVEMTESIRSGRFEIEDMNAALSDYADTTSSTFNATLDPIDESKIALNNLTLAGSELGSTIQEALGPIFQSISEVLKDLTKWFKGLNDSTKQVILVVLAIVAAIGPLLVIFGALAGAISNIMIGWGIMSQFIAGPLIASIGAVIGPILAVVAVFGVLMATSQGFRMSMQQVFEGIMKIFNGLIDFITGVFTGNWEKALSGIIGILSGLWDSISGIWKAPFNVLIDVINWVLRQLNKISVTIPDWFKYIGLGNLAGQQFGFNFSELAYMANGGTLMSGMAMVAEAGPELLLQQGNSTKVIPLSGQSKSSQSQIIDYDKLGKAVFKAISQSRFVLDDDGFVRIVRDEILKVV